MPPSEGLDSDQALISQLDVGANVTTGSRGTDGSSALVLGDGKPGVVNDIEYVQIRVLLAVLL